MLKARKNFFKLFILGIMAAVCALVGVTFVSSFSAYAEEPITHVCDESGYCLPCDVATRINTLPNPEDITIENAAEITEQIHTIDRLKYEMSDEEVEIFYSLLTEVDAYYMPTRYANAIARLQEFKGFTQFVITKKFDLASNTTPDLSFAEVTFAVESLDSGKTTELTLFDLAAVNGAFSSDADMYQASQDGWTFSYAMPAGTYRITELNTDKPLIINGEEVYTQCASMSFNGEAVAGNGITVTLQEGQNNVVFIQNERFYAYKVQGSDNQPIAGVAFTYTYVDDIGEEQTIAGTTNTNGMACVIEGDEILQPFKETGNITLTIPETIQEYCVGDRVELSCDFSGTTITDTNGKTLATMVLNNELCTITLTKHTYTEVVTPPACKEQGYTTYTCDCGYQKKDAYVEASGHSYTNYVSNGDATCATDGTKTAICNNGCGESDTQTDVGSALGHSYTNYVSKGDATCTTDGTKTAICDNGCGESNTQTDVGSALGHSYTNYVSNGDATCTTDGTKTAICDKGCGESDTQTDVGSALGHNYGDIIEEKAATCTESGIKAHYHCVECDTYFDEEKNVSDYEDLTVPALGHNYSPWMTTKEPTTTEYGERKQVCIQCGDIVIEQTPMVEPLVKDKDLSVVFIVIGVIVVMGIVAVVATKNDWSK